MGPALLDTLQYKSKCALRQIEMDSSLKAHASICNFQLILLCEVKVKNVSGLYASNRGRFLKYYWKKILDNSKKPSFSFSTF